MSHPRLHDYISVKHKHHVLLSLEVCLLRSPGAGEQNSSVERSHLKTSETDCTTFEIEVCQQEEKALVSCHYLVIIRILSLSRL
jgi:hypothetical protein